jgi:hypothetical protein
MKCKPNVKGSINSAIIYKAPRTADAEFIELTKNFEVQVIFAIRN